MQVAIIINGENEKENSKCINQDYAINDKALIINDGIECKSMEEHIGHFPFIKVPTNET